MATFLFDEIIFGPVLSRRLGNSLGINLLPVDCKVCNFNCIYCECGWTNNATEKGLMKARGIKMEMDKKLAELKAAGTKIDTITFAGNGEPSIHPEFDTIIDFTLKLRNRYYPNARVAVLSNATMLHKQKVFNALQKIEMNILKLDSAFEETIKKLNKPAPGFSLERVIENLLKFEGHFILQTMFVKGNHEGQPIDNTTDHEINAWLGLVQKLNPEMVMVYTIRRNTPIDTLVAVSEKELENISAKVKALGIEALVSA